MKLISNFVSTTLIMISPVSAVSLLQVDDFTTGTAEWTNGGGSPTTADTGLTGGSYLTNTSDGTGRQGRQLMWNDDQWTGDYVSAGVSGISLEVANTGVDTVSLRLAFNGPGGWFITEPFVLDAVGAGTALTPIDFFLSASDLSYVTGGTNSFADTLGGVTRMEIISASGTPSLGGNSPNVLRGENLNSVLLIDNIQAIPEPSVSSFMIACLISCALRRRRGC